jgi:cephalosporin hydroxylase
MYPFWKEIVEPALLASGAKRVIEVGALRGATTAHLLDLLGPESELHVVDPLPQFDPSEHARRFPGRYIFHRDISHNVLPDLPAADAALIDGDHNWFTVYHELRMLRETARGAGVPMPLVIMHDVCWPYGRRDLYYVPERIPEEFRQPYERRGLKPGRRELLDEGGLNQELANAIEEGGSRNGVMTALDDFEAEHDRPLRRVVLPIYYGLALVADQELLDARPELKAFLDGIEGAEARYEQLELVESIRLEERLEHHESHFAITGRAERAAHLYLDLLKGALLDEHYLENELRIGHLLERVGSGAAVDSAMLNDPVRYMANDLQRLRQARRAGGVPAESPEGANGASSGLAYTDIGRVRLDHLEECLDTIREEVVRGDWVEAGTGRGGAAIFMRGYLEAYNLGRPRVWVADRFGGGAAPSENGSPSFAPDLNAVREGFSTFGLLDGRVAFLQGPLSNTLNEAPIKKIALLRIGGHDSDEHRAALEALYDKVALGGIVVIDDYRTPECVAAIDEFRSEQGVAEPLERIDWSGAWWRKLEHVREPERITAAPARAEGDEPERRQPARKTKDLSVVVVFHNMRREADRTLYSLSRKYQQGVESLDYEVIVVENGSDPERRLGEEFVRSFGPEFRYLDLAEESQPSPAPALNRGVGLSIGRAVALMIDGAHVLTPGVLRFAMLGLSSYSPAVVTTQQWYVGPGQQNEMVAKGYDQEFEDRLFDEIAWPTDGYKLFDIGHFIGGRDWFDNQWESNCIFVPRPLLEQSGGMDESFSAPGGGFVNLDFFERMANSPGTNVVTILGEGSFHQVHGGTTTNVGAVAERSGLIDSYHDSYAELRGRRFVTPNKEIHYVGTLPEAARRTRPRRMGAPIYFKQAHVEGTDGRPGEGVPIPDDLRMEFIDAFWRSKEWHQTTWSGKWMGKAPTDLFAYQEVLFRIRPDWILETGTGGGGRALFLASICDLIGGGRVLSVDDQAAEKLAEHPRITYLPRDPTEPDTAAEVRETIGEHPRLVVILGAAKRRKIEANFEHYGPLVPVSSYLILEDTILNGNPVWTGFGPGPREAAGTIIREGDFEPDPSLERYGVTFNPGGFLKRVRRSDH